MSRVPYQLLELNIISAQDLAHVSKNLRTYAVAWVNPDRKLRTRIDTQGHTNPTWNDKFVFRIDDSFLNSDTSALMIEIYATGWLRDTPVGSVTVLISNLIPPSVRLDQSSRRFVALQIRRRSGRPQGILNMGVSLLDNTMRSMPLYKELGAASALGFPDLLDEKLGNNKKDNKKINNNNEEEGKKIRLFRSLSDKTDLTTKSGATKKRGGSVCNGSVGYYGQAAVANCGGGCGSLVNGGSAVNGGSVVNESVCNSDVGPSPSVVAAAVACGLYPIHQGPEPRPGSSVLEDWTVEEKSTEGLKSKIERWKMELPQVYDQRYQRLENNKRREKRRHGQKKTAEDDEDDGLFSCFGTALGCEFRIVCGASKKKKKKSGKKRRRSSSKNSISEIYS